MFYLFLVLRLYDPKTMMLSYCPTVVATILNIWCSVARLLLRLPCFSFTIIQSWNYDDLLSRYSRSNRPEHLVFCFAYYSDYPLVNFTIIWSWTLSILRSYDPETMIIYCLTAVVTVLNIWCSVACLLLRLPPVNHLLTATGTLYIYNKMLWSYDVHMKNSRKRKGLK